MPLGTSPYHHFSIPHSLCSIHYKAGISKKPQKKHEEEEVQLTRVDPVNALKSLIFGPPHSSSISLSLTHTHTHIHTYNIELHQYSPALLRTPAVVAVNKLDLLVDKEERDRVLRQVRRISPWPVFGIAVNASLLSSAAASPASNNLHHVRGLEKLLVQARKLVETPPSESELGELEVERKAMHLIRKKVALAESEFEASPPGEEEMMMMMITSEEEEEDFEDQEE